MRAIPGWAKRRTGVAAGTDVAALLPALGLGSALSELAGRAIG